MDVDAYLWQADVARLLPFEDWSFDEFRGKRLEDWLDLIEGMEMVGDG